MAKNRSGKPGGSKASSGNKSQYQQRTKTSSLNVGGKKVFEHKKSFSGQTIGERVHDYRKEKLSRKTDPAVVAEQEKTKRALAYAGSAASGTASAASAAKQTVIFSEGGINPSTPEPDEPDHDQNQYSWGGS